MGNKSSPSIFEPLISSLDSGEKPLVVYINGTFSTQTGALQACAELKTFLQERTKNPDDVDVALAFNPTLSLDNLAQLAGHAADHCSAELLALFYRIYQDKQTVFTDTERATIRSSFCNFMLDTSLAVSQAIVAKIEEIRKPDQKVFLLAHSHGSLGASIVAKQLPYVAWAYAFGSPHPVAHDKCIDTIAPNDLVRFFRGEEIPEGTLADHAFQTYLAAQSEFHPVRSVEVKELPTSDNKDLPDDKKA